MLLVQRIQIDCINVIWKPSKDFLSECVNAAISIFHQRLRRNMVLNSLPEITISLPGALCFETSWYHFIRWTCTHNLSNFDCDYV